MDEQLEGPMIAEPTAEIVAYVPSHKLRVPQVPDAINAIGVELASLGAKAEPGPLEKPEPL